MMTVWSPFSEELRRKKPYFEMRSFSPFWMPGGIFSFLVSP
jgi:hypothetical protein